MFNKYHFIRINNKLLFTFVILFFITNLILQISFFANFKNPNYNADESDYVFFVQNMKSNILNNFSNQRAQPFIFVSYLFDQLFHDSKFSVRFVSVLSAIFILFFSFFYFIKNKQVEFIKGNEFLNKLIVFAVIFAVLGILEQHFIGTSDIFSVAFGLPALILLTEKLVFDKKANNSILIGFLFAIAFTSRPTFLIILVGYFSSLFIFYRSKIFTKHVFYTIISAVFFVVLINFDPLLKTGKLVLDEKDIPKEIGVTWFDRNYLMAKKWDSGEIPNTQWISSAEVLTYKKLNPGVFFPKNYFDILVHEPGMFSRQIFRMFYKSMYSSFRYMYILFPFLILYSLLISNKNKFEIKKINFIVSFYFISLFIFMAFALKLMEFRWMQLLLVFYSFYSLYFVKNLSENKRILFLNVFFLTGVSFFILKMLK